MRHFDYQLTLTLPSAPTAGQASRKPALVQENLQISGSTSYTRSYRFDPAAHTESDPEAARWTPAEEASGYHAA